jgi:hypothetical protein
MEYRLSGVSCLDAGLTTRLSLGLDAIRNYRREYNEKQQVFYDKPLHDWSSHFADAFRYLAIGLDESDVSWSSDLPINTKWVV